jgi:hypothetical protein
MWREFCLVDTHSESDDLATAEGTCGVGPWRSRLATPVAYSPDLDDGSSLRIRLAFLDMLGW